MGRPRKKRKEGRPTDYDPKYCEMLIQHFEVEPYFEKSLPHFKEGEVSWEDLKEVSNPLPTITGFSKKIGVSSSTIYEWVKNNPEFSSAFTRVKEMRKDMIIVNGLKGLYNPAFAIFAMKNMTDWKDGPLIDQSQHNHTHFTVIVDGEGSKDQADSKTKSRFQVVDQL